MWQLLLGGGEFGCEHSLFSLYLLCLTQFASSVVWVRMTLIIAWHVIEELTVCTCIESVLYHGWTVFWPGCISFAYILA